eukprot:CAMPEP_0172565000 /NCGR_PEP_ID=MMETSP1067-20121228/106548_1 /TAXON_ID=265564 ORGANISM="Thalassiosira punctigera, Strain Tpunct2005C2" /NCGR_SAMPLE_ID=MMETSP1067 /ASSEMBLY_ACC=CAM_ASM_000444 /LENGTH=361 /DNA_ID=CAMNT_0013355803 /DNA_START=26 /DNA_END=1111 /DNA_ORIENTATION=-
MRATDAIHHIATIGMLLLGTCHCSNAFSFSHRRLTRSSSTLSLPSSVKSTVPSSTALSGTTVPPTESSTVGTVGNGYLPVLLAKLAAHRRHGKSWIICPNADVDKMRQLSAMDGFGEALPNLELVPASETDRVEELLKETDALLIGTDDVDSVIDPSILNYLLDPEKCGAMKRVVAMSRNLNGAGMGMFVSASRRAANAQVWDNANAEAYRTFESNVRGAAEGCGADWTLVRAGTLKGGACGDGSAENDEAVHYPQYLAPCFYEMTKNDIITWQLLFDCNVRGVKLTRGDVAAGPGMRAVFAATGSDYHEGDSGRCGVAEAMVRSLEVEEAANVDFGVGTVKSREAPSEEEWGVLFRECLA